MGRIFWVCGLVLGVSLAAVAERGYFRQPALHGETIVFAAEGDLWRVSLDGGAARRLTTHPESERNPSISPDGSLVAFSASYEGPTEVYVMPIDGGTPTRLTYQAEGSYVCGWSPSGSVLYETTHYSTLPDYQLVTVPREGGTQTRVPLHQASEGSYDETGNTLFFVRPSFHNNNTRFYQGGTARNLWAYTAGSEDAVNLTADHPGEHSNPRWSNGRVYFICERVGAMNIWSMRGDGSDLQQHTQHTDWDVKEMDVDGDRIVYRIGGDIRLLNLSTGEDELIEIDLVSDFDQLREHWVTDPMRYLTSADIHPEGKSVVVTARGDVAIIPVKNGRVVHASTDKSERYRDTVFLPAGDELLALSDQTGELEFYTLATDGMSATKAQTSDGDILRYEAVPSPDGKFFAYDDKNNDLWIHTVESGEKTLISTNREGIRTFRWSQDSRWLAFVQYATNTYSRIHIHNIESGESQPVTSDRVNSMSPAFSPDGKWLYFLSDRELQSTVGSPWGPRQPEPFFDKTMRVYHMALQAGERSPFKAPDELSHDDEKKDEEQEEDEEVESSDTEDSESTDSADEASADSDADEEVDEKKDEPDEVVIEFDGIERRVLPVPVPSGNYSGLAVNKTAVYFVDREQRPGGDSRLVAVSISHDDPKVSTIVGDIQFYRMALKGKHILVRKSGSLYVFDANGKGPNLDKSRVDLRGWSFPIDVAEDWRQIYVDAWRLQRDYFYDPGMHGLDWDALRDKYLPLVDRVTTRDELNDVIGQLMAHLSALHVSVRGGDMRDGDENISVATLGARLERDEAAGGYRIAHIYETEPDYPEWYSPLHDPELAIENGDLLESINGTPVLDVAHPAVLLRNQGGRQVRIRVKSAATDESKDYIVTPMTNESLLRYRDWKYGRRKHVEERSEGKIGYVHLSAMGGGNLSEWYRNFYPVFDRQGLILDVRHNRGGNIDSIVLAKLIRQAWSYWSDRVSAPQWNMQYAFRGHAVILVDEKTASDGEAVAEGFRRLGIGPVIGMRTWGGQIWLSDRNRLRDRGIARAPQSRVYSPEGEWLIEGHGVEPDTVIDNLPHATFNGADAQLDAGIDYLLQKIEEDPREVPQPPDPPR